MLEATVFVMPETLPELLNFVVVCLGSIVLHGSDQGDLVSQN
jgi:hypothetical protein